MASGERARAVELGDFGENPEVWCVIVPFELACVKDQADEDEDAPEAPPRQRPLPAIDFSHAVWL
jgi:hypothetical protein